MQGPETLYFFKDDLGMWWYVQNDLVLQSPTPVPLQYNPTEWEDIGIMNQRNPKYFATDRTFSIPLEFPEDGARILKYIFYKKGKNFNLYLVIAKQQLYFDATHYGFYYTLLDKFRIDLSEFSHEGPKVVVNILEGGIPKFLKAREGIKYEIPIDGPDTIKIKIDGVKLKGKKRFLVIDATYAHGIGTDPKELLPMQETNSEGFFFNIRFKDEVGSLTDANYDFIQGEDLSTSDKWNGLCDDTVTFSCHFEGTIVKENYGIYGNRVGFDVKLETNTGRVFTLFNVSHVFANNFLDAVPWKFSVESAPVTLFKDETFFVYQTPTAFQSNNAWRYDDVTIFEYQTIDRKKPTYIKARRPLGVFEDLTSKLSDGTVQAESNTLETYKTFAISCGNAIRGLPNAKIKSSMSDFFSSFNTILSIGMGPINGKLKLERKPYWIDFNAPIDLFECKGLKVSNDKDYSFSSIKIGYPEQTYDNVNGKEEFNNTHIYSTPDTTEGKEHTLMSVYRTDCYGIEFVRASLDGKTTTDSDSDNDVFVIHINPVPIIDPIEGEVYELDRSLNPYATGLLEAETVFNLALSPKQCLFRNGQYIRSCFYLQDTEYLRFQTTEKNSALSVAPPGGQVVTENADVEIARLGDRLFVPVKLEFETRVPVDLLEQLAINPLKSFSTSYVGVPLVGIPNKTGIHPENNEAQAYELLASPDTDLTPLIDVFE